MANEILKGLWGSGPYLKMLFQSRYPTNIPTIPMIPARVGGAGMGSLKAENTMPTTNPVAKLSSTSFIGGQF